MTTATDLLDLFDLCLKSPENDRIAKCAMTQGMAVSAHVRYPVQRETGTNAAAAWVVVLSEEESGRFLAASGEQFRPNDRLKRAMERAARLTPH